MAELCSGCRRLTQHKAYAPPLVLLSLRCASEISTLLTTYYKSLYSEDPLDSAAADKLLAETTLPTLTSTQLDSLNAPITVDDIRFMVKSLSTDKAPGSLRNSTN